MLWRQCSQVGTLWDTFGTLSAKIHGDMWFFNDDRKIQSYFRVDFVTKKPFNGTVGGAQNYFNEHNSLWETFGTLSAKIHGDMWFFNDDRKIQSYFRVDFVTKNPSIAL